MTKNIRMKDLKTILQFYRCKIPGNIHQIKKNENHIIITNLCVSNCDCQEKYRKILTILYKKRMISHQKKVKYDKTKKRRICIRRQTRVHSPISYLDA